MRWMMVSGRIRMGGRIIMIDIFDAASFGIQLNPWLEALEIGVFITLALFGCI